MTIRVVGPDAPGPSPAEWRRLFQGHRLSAARRDRIRSGGRVIAYCAGRTVGLAAYEQLECELRIHEFGVDREAPCGAASVVATLLDALELACLAGGCHRLVVVSRGDVDDRLLTDHGFRALGHGAVCAFEKRYSF